MLIQIILEKKIKVDSSVIEKADYIMVAKRNGVDLETVTNEELAQAPETV